MKGRVKISTDGHYIFFGNLGNGYYGDRPAFAIGGITGDNTEFSANTFAHDLLEHTAKHRTNIAVTWEEEIRAVGAIEFVRAGQFSAEDELRDLIQGVLAKTEIKPIPKLWQLHFEKHGYSDWLYDRLLEEYGKEYDDILYHVVLNYDYGYARAKRTFDEQWKASRAWSWITSLYERILWELEDAWDNEVSFWFDTETCEYRIYRKPLPNW